VQNFGCEETDVKRPQNKNLNVFKKTIVDLFECAFFETLSLILSSFVWQEVSRYFLEFLFYFFKPLIFAKNN